MLADVEPGITLLPSVSLTLIGLPLESLSIRVPVSRLTPTPGISPPILYAGLRLPVGGSWPGLWFMKMKPVAPYSTA